MQFQLARNWCEAWVFSARCCLYTASMAVMVEMHHTSCEPGMRAEIAAIIEHALSDRSGDWRVSIIGSQAMIGGK